MSFSTPLDHHPINVKVLILKTAIQITGELLKYVTFIHKNVSSGYHWKKETH